MLDHYDWTAWIALFASNILGVELRWRCYFLPRHEVALGRAAWLGNGGGTPGGIIIHAVFNGSRFVVATCSLGALSLRP